MTITEETLMAYSDDELDAAEAMQVEAAVRNDPRLAARIAEHRLLRARLHAAFGPELAEPVPQRLIDATMRPAGTPRYSPKTAVLGTARLRRVHAWWHSPLPLAAAASLVLGVGIGFVAWHAPRPVLRENAQGSLVADGRLAHALSYELSGTGAPGGVDIVLSFLSKSGAYCRTFRVARDPAPAGLACRSGAQWRIEVLAQSIGEAGTDSGFRTAGASLPPAVLQGVQSRIAKPPLDRAGEIAARGRDWQAPPR